MPGTLRLRVGGALIVLPWLILALAWMTKPRGRHDLGDFPSTSLVLFTLVMLVCGAVIYWSGRQARERERLRDEGKCTKCGYSLAGLANDAACPECGSGSARP